MKSLIAGLFLLLSFWASGQSLVAKRISAGIDIGAGFRSKQLSPSLAYYQLLSFDKRQLFSIGYTLNFRTFYADGPLDYLTAPARLSRNKSGLSALGAPLTPATIDTMTFDKVSLTSLNFGIRAQFRISILEVGASADLLGLAFGKGRTGRYQSSTGKFAVQVSDKDSLLSFQGTNARQSAEPTRINARLLGDNNHGTLATEVYARVRISQQFGIKAGYQWLITEMNARNRNTVDDNSRFRNRTDFAYVAITFFSF